MQRIFCLLVIICTLGHLNSAAQLTAADRNNTIDSLVKKLNDQYVFPDIASAMVKKLRQKQAQKQYDTISNAAVFANVLTQDLQAVSNDRHLRIGYSSDVLPKGNDEPMEPTAAERERFSQFLLHENYGINKLEVLKGNIGYIDLKWLCGPEFAGDTYTAMMNYVAHTDALIIDLRACGGSMSPDAIPLVCSYFFEKPVHLNDLYWRKGNTTNQYWTYSYVPGKKYLNKPIYILTSGRTFSGAEELAYDLKNLKRATLIGETTGGGANGGGDVRLTDHFNVFLPVGRAINPITKTNWEGVGVAPDSVINANKALYAARLLALRTINTSTKDAEWNGFLQNAISELEKNPPLYKPLRFELKGFEKARDVYVAGSFNSWSNTATHMQREGDRWIATAESEPGKVMYKFVVDGQWITDPSNPQTEADGPNTNSVKTVD